MLNFSHEKQILPILVFFLCPTLVFAQLDSAAMVADITLKVFQKAEVEASYPGGDGAWRKLLEKPTKGQEMPSFCMTSTIHPQSHKPLLSTRAVCNLLQIAGGWGLSDNVLPPLYC